VLKEHARRQFADMTRTAPMRIIQQMDEASAAIAAAVEEQGAATHEITRNIQSAHSRTAEVSHSIGLVSKDAKEPVSMRLLVPWQALQAALAPDDLFAGEVVARVLDELSQDAAHDVAPLAVQHRLIEVANVLDEHLVIGVDHVVAGERSRAPFQAGTAALQAHQKAIRHRAHRFRLGCKTSGCR
jgi:hypothetical protein